MHLFHCPNMVPVAGVEPHLYALKIQCFQCFYETVSIFISIYSLPMLSMHRRIASLVASSSAPCISSRSCSLISPALLL